MTEEYITQVSEETEDRVTKKLSQDFSRTDSRTLGALSKLDEFLLNPQLRTCSGTVPGTSRNKDLENGEPVWDRSQNDTYPEVELSVRQASNSADSDHEETTHKTARFYLSALEHTPLANGIHQINCIAIAACHSAFFQSADTHGGCHVDMTIDQLW